MGKADFAGLIEWINPLEGRIWMEPEQKTIKLWPKVPKRSAQPPGGDDGDGGG